MSAVALYAGNHPDFHSLLVLVASVTILAGIVLVARIRLMRVYRGSDREVQQQARVAMITGNPLVHPRVNEAATEWAKFRMFLWGLLTLVFSSGIIYAVVTDTGASQLLNILLTIVFAAQFVATVRRFLAYRRHSPDPDATSTMASPSLEPPMHGRKLT